MVSKRGFRFLSNLYTSQVQNKELKEYTLVRKIFIPLTVYVSSYPKMYNTTVNKFHQFTSLSYPSSHGDSDVGDYSDWSPIFQTCHQYNWSPRSVTIVDITVDSVNFTFMPHFKITEIEIAWADAKSNEYP